MSVVCSSVVVVVVVVVVVMSGVLEYKEKRYGRRIYCNDSPGGRTPSVPAETWRAGNIVHFHQGRGTFSFRASNMA